jgi:hypothetical protein
LNHKTVKQVELLLNIHVFSSQPHETKIQSRTVVTPKGILGVSATVMLKPNSYNIHYKFELLPHTSENAAH